MAEEAYPARIWVQEPPEYPVFQYVLHLPTPVQEYGQHALAQLYNASIFFCLCRLCSVVGHGVLFGYGRYNQGWMQSDKFGAQRGELGVSALYF